MTAIDTSRQPGTTPAPARTTVFFDGGCPVCRREIGFYRARRGAERIDWVDVSASDEAEVAPGLCRRDAMARFHVRSADGQMVSGARAFIVLWRVLPAFRPVGLILSAPPLPWISEQAYRLFLWLRPRLIRR